MDEIQPINSYDTALSLMGMKMNDPEGFNFHASESALHWWHNELLSYL